MRKANMRKISVATLILAMMVLFIQPAHAKSRWVMGGLIGAGVGVGAGVGAAVLICSLPEGHCRKGLTYGLLPVAGGAVGFGIGALIGSAFKKESPSAYSSDAHTNQEVLFFEPTLIVDPISGTYGIGGGVKF